MSAQRGRPFEPGNKFGQGRPKGSRNKAKASSAARDLLDKYEANIQGKCITMALQGNETAMRLCMERISPPLRESAIRLKISKVRNAKDIEKAGTRVIEAGARGAITPTAQVSVMKSLEMLNGIFEVGQIATRLDAVEKAIAADSSDGRSPQALPALNESGGAGDCTEAHDQ